MEGTVYLQRLPGASSEDTTLGAGQHMRTEDGRAEVFFALDSLSFVRLGKNSHIEVVTVSEDAAAVRFIRGVMVVETFDARRASPLEVLLGNASVTLEMAGEYRFFAPSDGEWFVQPIAGRATAHYEGQKHRVRAGRVLSLNAGGVETKKATKLRDDPLIEWHEQRAKVIRDQTALALASGRSDAYLPAQSVLRKGLPGEHTPLIWPEDRLPSVPVAPVPIPTPPASSPPPATK